MDVNEFGTAWIAAWNAHDLDQILSHYEPDVVVRTPMAVTLGLSEDGVIVGIDALRAYWRQGLDLLPNLKFDLIEVLTGVNSATIVYRNERAQLVAESVHFSPRGLVDQAAVTYGAFPSVAQVDGEAT